MPRINSRSKGCKGERDLAKVLEKWTKKTFARTPSSGGLSWKTTNAKGDIVCTKEGHYFPFCVENKSYKELNFQHPLILPNAEILKFWEQCKRDAEIAKKVPLLTMRYNGMAKGLYFIIVKYKDFLRMGFELGNANLYYNPWFDIIIMPSNILFESSYKIIKENLKTSKKS